MALTVGVFLLLFGAGLWAFTRMGHRFAMVERGVGLVKKKRRIAFSVFFFNDTATTEIYTLSLHDALPISGENAKKYFDKYQKLKRTYEALTTLTKETKEEIDHLASISTSLDIALKEEDLVQIKEELIESGYIRQIGRAHV